MGTFSVTIQWVLSATSAFMLWKMGNKVPYAPVIGLFNQIIWVVYVVMTKQWGLMPGVIMYAVIHARNTYLWQRDES